jgi:hypothetical protein
MPSTAAAVRRSLEVHRGVPVADAALAVELSLEQLGEQVDHALGGEQLVAPCSLWS